MTVRIHGPLDRAERPGVEVARRVETTNPNN
jgi:hypothetical protein